MLHQMGLFFHIVAIMIVAGGTVGGMMAERQLWKGLKTGGNDLAILVPIINNVATFVKVGVIMFLVSGLVMLYSVNWFYISQPWFIAKFSLFMLLPIRGFAVAQPMTSRITTLIMHAGDNPLSDLPELMQLRKRVIRFHIIQYVIVALIILLVLFRIGS